MSANKEVPVNVKTYYKLIYQRTLKRQEVLNQKIEDITRDINTLYDGIKNKLEYYKQKYNIVIDKDCFNNDIKALNRIIRILATCEANESEELGVIARMFKKLEQVYHLKHKRNIYEKITHLTMQQYIDLLKVYFTEVQRQLVLEGNAYNIGSRVGVICIYRYLNTKKSTFLDFAATKKKKQEILSRGGNIYDKKQEQWCKERGIEYTYEEHRVYRRDEYLYGIHLFNSRAKDWNSLTFTSADYRGSNVRGKTNEELIAECNGDKDKIMELPLDIKTKLTLCLSVDSFLYSKFIRNEDQKSVTVRKTNSED